MEGGMEKMEGGKGRKWREGWRKWGRGGGNEERGGGNGEGMEEMEEMEGRVVEMGGGMEALTTKQPLFSLGNRLERAPIM